MSNLPSYLAAAKPVPLANRAPWRKTIMPAYIGVMLWFAFWKGVVNGGLNPCPPDGMLVWGFVPAFLGLIIGAVICHFFFYMPPAMLGVQTGLPLYVVGTSTYGARGGLLMPGFLMGLLQFGWLGVNAFLVSQVLCTCFGFSDQAPNWYHGIIASVFAFLAAFVGLKGIRYVGRVGTYLPLIPVVVLLVLLVTCWSGIGKYRVGLYHTPQFDQQVEAERQRDLKERMDREPRLPTDETMNFESQPPQPAPPPQPKVEPPPPKAPPPALTEWQVMQILIIYVVGFFATAGAAGADIAMNARNNEDVHIGGITGILLPTVLASEVVLFIVAGAYGSGFVTPWVLQPLAVDRVVAGQQGVVVAEVFPHTPPATATMESGELSEVKTGDVVGVKPGDVILEYATKRVNSIEALQQVVEKAAGGKPQTLVLIHRDEKDPYYEAQHQAWRTAYDKEVAKAKENYPKDREEQVAEIEKWLSVRDHYEPYPPPKLVRLAMQGFATPAHVGSLDPVTLMPDILGGKLANWLMIALAISAFPGACFSSFIAANSFKTTMPRVNPFLSVGIGAVVAAALAVSGWAGEVSKVFAVIGASFGPVCGAMFADYLLSRRRWSGPRAGFNPAGWISWIVGFVLGAFNLVIDLLLVWDPLKHEFVARWDWVASKLPHLVDRAPQLMDPVTKVCNYVPLPPVTAFVVGFGLYVLLSVLGARTRKLPMPGVTA